MKKYLGIKRIFTIWLLLFAGIQLSAQTITLEGCPNQMGDGGGGVITLIHNLNGTVLDLGVSRNTYSTTPIDGSQVCTGGFGSGFCETRIIWVSGSSRWEIQFTTNGSSWSAIYTNSSASEPNPPSLTLGTWTDVSAGTGFSCGGGISVLTGAVQSSLPVQLIDFVGRVENKNIVLSWRTSSELNNEKFEVEESQDGREFQKIGEVEGKGTTADQQSYSFKVENPRNRIAYYRLKQVDYDGQFEYSKVLSINFKREHEQVGEFYPNPSKFGLVNFDYISQENQEIVVSVFNVTGQLVTNQIKQVLNGNNNLIFDFSDLNTGIYIIKIEDERNSTHRKLIIEK